MRQTWYGAVLAVMLTFFCQTVQASPMTFAQIGTVELGGNITVSEVTNKKGETMPCFLGKDGKVWRSMMVAGIGSYPNTAEVDLKTLLKTAADKMREKDSLPNDDGEAVSSFALANGSTAYTTAVRNNAKVAALNINLFLIKGPTQVKMIVFSCPDGDTQFWRPVMLKIVESMALQ